MNAIAGILKELYENEAMLAFYSKSNCKECHGRGKLTVIPVGGTEQKFKICRCVIKTLKKEMM